MPNRVAWQPSFDVGDETVDNQHRHILEQCNLLAEHCQAGNGGDDRFQQMLDALMASAREHFAAEESRLAACQYPDLDDYRHEYEEFGYLAAEIITTENFDPLELQRFLTLWWVGHISGGAKRHGRYLRQDAPA
jgi:hemerythrin